MKAAIVIDDWKFKIFKKVLDDAGYKFEKHPGIIQNTISLIIETDTPGNLAKHVSRAQAISGQL